MSQPGSDTLRESRLLLMQREQIPVPKGPVEVW